MDFDRYYIGATLRILDSSSILFEFCMIALDSRNRCLQKFEVHTII